MPASFVRVATLCLALCAALAAAPAVAQQGGMPPGYGGPDGPIMAVPEDAPPLTGDRVERFIDTFRALKERYGEDVEINTPAQANAAMDLITDHGYAGPEQWTVTMHQVMRAYVHNSIGPEERAQMRRALDQIDAADMPAAQKEQMKAMMRSQMGWMTAESPDADVVAPYMDELAELLGDDR